MAGRFISIDDYRFHGTISQYNSLRDSSHNIKIKCMANHKIYECSRSGVFGLSEPFHSYSGDLRFDILCKECIESPLVRITSDRRFLDTREFLCEDFWDRFLQFIIISQ